jgi:hypothetical protein
MLESKGDGTKEQRPCRIAKFPNLESEEAGNQSIQASTRRLKGQGQAVELDVDEVAHGVAGLAAGGDVGAAGLLDWHADWNVGVSIKFGLLISG